MSSARELKLIETVLRWWKDRRKRDGFSSTLWELITLLWEFLRDSTPERRRRRYGDVQYDWDKQGQYDERHRGLAESVAGDVPFSLSAYRTCTFS